MEVNGGQVQILEGLTPDLSRFQLPGARPVILKGRQFKALMQELPGDWFSAWYNRYWVQGPTIVAIRAKIPFVVLRIAWKGHISCSQDVPAESKLKMHYFTFSYDPGINTHVEFEKPCEYATFEIHIDIRALFEYAMYYTILREFIEQVLAGKSSLIGDTAFCCPKEMIDAVFSVISNSYTGHEKMSFIQCKIKEVLIAALAEIGSPKNTLPQVLNSGDKAKLDVAGQFIAKSVPSYPGNRKICRHAGLNETKLTVGFRHFFGVSPYNYFLHQKMLAKEMLLSTNDSIERISDNLNYRWATGFTKEFKKHFGYTPSAFARNNKRRTNYSSIIPDI